MNVITDTLRALVQRKLWPVALLLVAALVAVPMLLAKNPATAPVVAPHTNGEGLPATFVSVADEADEDARRRVLGEAKDPFEPVELSKKAKADRKKAANKTEKTGGAATADRPASKSGGASAGGGGAPASGGSVGGGSEPPISEAPAPKPTYPLYSIKVRFGESDSEELETKTVERLAVLPDEDAPVLVYRGVEQGGKVAVFELTGSVVAQGDGKCEPTPEDCQILKLRAGETEFLTISDTGADTDAQYMLELVKIHTKTTTSKAELAKASTRGRKLLRKWSGNRRARYAFDARAGVLRKLDAKSAKRLTRSALRASL